MSAPNVFFSNDVLQIILQKMVSMKITSSYNVTAIRDWNLHLRWQQTTQWILFSPILICLQRLFGYPIGSLTTQMYDVIPTIRS